MVPRVHLVGIPVGTATDDLRRIVRTKPHTRYPVHTGDPDNIIGSVHIKELLRHLVSDQPVAAEDAREVPYIPMTMPLDEVLAAMRRGRSQMAVVMDEHGGTAGIITIEDLFEEVVGEIDEGRARTPSARCFRPLLVRVPVVKMRRCARRPLDTLGFNNSGSCWRFGRPRAGDVAPDRCSTNDRDRGGAFMTGATVYRAFDRPTREDTFLDAARGTWEPSTPARSRPIGSARRQLRTRRMLRLTRSRGS